MTTQIGELLEKLHAELKESPNLDADDRRLVEVVLADVRRLGAGEERHQSVTELAVAFESVHPSLAAALRMLASLLASAGV
jgi:Domain of unknown function (DUF4404)